VPAGARIYAVVEGNLQYFGQVEVAGEVVVFLAKGPYFDTAT